MTTLRLTKAELRAQTLKLAQLQKYLPTLQLKKALLQAEVLTAQQQLEVLLGRVEEHRNAVEQLQGLLSTTEFDPTSVQVAQVEIGYDHVAGVELPRLEVLTFVPIELSLFQSPAWVDPLVTSVQAMLSAIERSRIGEMRCQALKSELREVTTRVNLFEKILIPRTRAAIRKIKVFLGDIQLSAIAQAKVAKEKILSRVQEEET